MKPSDALALHRAAIRQVALCRGVTDVRVFGSALSGSDGEGSDLDLLVEPGPATTLFDIGAIRHELQRLLGLRVDVVTPGALPEHLRAELRARSIPV
jgi:uncharacterized protein